MSSAPGRDGGFGWDTYEDVDRPSMGSKQQEAKRGRVVPHHSNQGYSNEALVDGDEYFSDQTDYEEHYLAKRARQNSGTSLTSREPPVGASPVHAGPGCGGGYEGIATYEQRRHNGKSMPQLNEPQRQNPPRPQPRHRYEAVPSQPQQQPPPPPYRPSKAAATPTRRSNSTVSAGTPPRRQPLHRSPSTTSLLRRGPGNGASTPASRFMLSSPATSPLRLQHQQQRSPNTPRRNLTPLMNSMSPQPLPRTPRQSEQHLGSQYNHRRAASVSHQHQKTAVIAPSTYTSYDLAGRAYGDGSRSRCELEEDMAEMQASLLTQQSSLEPLMRRSPRRKSLSPAGSPLTPPPGAMDMHQLACSRGTVGPALRVPTASPVSQSSYKSNKSSWISLPGIGSSFKVKPPPGVLFATGTILIVSGLVTSILAFYMLSQKGRHYYLDLAVLSAFASLMLGVVGLRSRVAQLLPNRNYVTGYILVTAFSVLTAAGLLTLVLLPAPARPHPHATPATPTADMAAGAVCGTAALTLLLAATGTLTSYCCRYPPPDNRVAHAAQGFSV